MRAPASCRRDDLDIRVGGTLYELIAKGQYEAFGVGYRKVRVFTRDKLAVEYDVLVPDSHAESGHRRVRLCRFYNIRSGPDRRVVAPANGDYLREWTLATGRHPSRHDRMGPHVFVGVAFRVDVATVLTDHRKQNLVEPLHYSKVARLLERLAGGAS